MLIYSLLHLTGYDLSIEELKNFRQLHSKTPGHPEVGSPPALKPLPARSVRASPTPSAWRLPKRPLRRNLTVLPLVVDNRTYVFLGDGCMMEGISHEVCSLAGVWKLGKLIAIYDDNGISIDGDVKGWFGDDTAAVSKPTAGTLCAALMATMLTRLNVQ